MTEPGIPMSASPLFADATGLTVICNFEFARIKSEYRNNEFQRDGIAYEDPSSAIVMVWELNR